MQIGGSSYLRTNLHAQQDRLEQHDEQKLYQLRLPTLPKNLGFSSHHPENPAIQSELPDMFALKNISKQP